MSMQAKDIAQMLHLSERTVRRWVQEGKIPAYQFHRQYRFDRLELQDWMLKRAYFRNEKQILPKPEANAYGAVSLRQHLLYRALSKGGVFDQIDAKSKAEAISLSTALIAAKLNADADVIKEMLVDREAMSSTGILNGVAIPHTRDFLLPKPVDFVSVVYLKQPIQWGALDAIPVHTLFFVMACENWRHLQLLAKIALLCQQPTFSQLLRQRANVQQLLTFIKCRENGES